MPKAVEYASFPRRAFAFLIDVFVVTFLTLSILLLARQDVVKLSKQAYAGSLIFQSPLELAVWAVNSVYSVLLISLWGQTVGKRLLKIKVVRADTLDKPGFSKALLREIPAKILSGFLFYFGYLAMLWDPKKRTWHDRLVDTWVVKT